MNYDRIYEYRFKGVDRNKKLSTWKIIAEFIHEKLGKPSSMIDPAAGDCEFINQVPAKKDGRLIWASIPNEQRKAM
jgi:hypothetical protein